MNRHQQREVAINSLYQHLLLNKDIRKCVFDAMHRSMKLMDTFIVLRLVQRKINIRISKRSMTCCGRIGILIV